VENVMQLSKGFDYAVRSLTHLATLPKGSTAELRSIADAQNVPVSYLAKLMRNLVRAGIVTSNLGRDGGYILRRAPEEISLLVIYEAIEGELRLVRCMDHEDNCTHFGSCRQVPFWKRLREAVEGVLRETTLRDLLPTAPDFPVKEMTHARTGA
jgi:Rrf2 family protein